MEKIRKYFLQALKAALKNEQVPWEEELESGEWEALFHLADMHHVLPMVYEAVYACPAAAKAGALFQPFKQRALRTVTVQAINTGDFLRLFPALRRAGVTPLVVKGIICRELYPKPDCRVSSDEDLLIPPEQFPLCHEAMLRFGMALTEPEQDTAAAYEVSYDKKGSLLHIELHKSLFPPESEAYGELNCFFEGVLDRAVQQQIQGTDVLTMGYTDHLFYLLCHAFKHFLHSGFGIRQVCDICLFANAHGGEIGWQQVLENCRQIRADKFAAALFQIGEKYLTFDPEAACYPPAWREAEVDEGPMLQELLDSGIYGAGTMSRKHSSNITLNAVTADRQGRKAGSGLMGAVFPSAEKLSGRYPYLKEKPYLLPAAWIHRIVKYGQETASSSGDNNAADSLRIGNERVELLRQYGIIK